MLTSIVGTNWGDEGKGRMVDLLSEKYDIVVRYQGGNNAGHTVINEKGKFVMNLMPSGICRENTVNILGPGIVIDLEHLYGEVRKLSEKGVAVTPQHLKISDRALPAYTPGFAANILRRARAPGSRRRHRLLRRYP